MAYKIERMVGNRLLSMETGVLAGQSDGAVTVRYGDTLVLVTANMSDEPREGIDFFPLTVDYEERLYAAGKIPGGYIKREGRPSQDAVLASRLTDRPLRPLFPKGFRNDVQVIITVLSADQENDPDILAIIGASSALMISGIPFAGPVSASRVGYVNGEFVLNPTYSDLQQSSVDLVVAGTRDAVVMVEAGAKQVTEEIMLKAIQFGQEANQAVLDMQEEMARACGKPTLQIAVEVPSAALEEAVDQLLGDRLAVAINTVDKTEREEAIGMLKKEVLEELSESFDPRLIAAVFESRMKAIVRSQILTMGIRPDGRDLTTIRPISSQVGILPRTHGSGLFTRGQTQVLTIATLGSLSEEQRMDGLGQEETKRFMHHYNFPPFSTGEVKRLGSPGRREIGHGALAERAILPVIPSPEEFPYTIRLVSEVLSSNGSTSMASVCGSTLALMDAGVPISAPVAGVAMGLVKEGDRFAVLTDIQGIEDALGDMDFKVAGTEMGVTALQMDIKIKGINDAIMQQALSQAREGRLFILERMQETISAARPQLSPYAPRMYKITINPDKIRNVIGPGGKTIRSIIDETKVTIDVQDDGTVVIGSSNPEAADRAIKMIENLTREVEVGGIYMGKVTRLMNFGAFVEILPGKEGLVHISELADYRVPSVEDAVKVGDEVMVMVTEIDRMGRINLSRRAVIEGVSPETVAVRQATRNEDRGPQGPRRRTDGPGGRPGGERRSPSLGRGQESRSSGSRPPMSRGR